MLCCTGIPSVESVTKLDTVHSCLIFCFCNLLQNLVMFSHLVAYKAGQSVSNINKHYRFSRVAFKGTVSQKSMALCFIIWSVALGLNSGPQTRRKNVKPVCEPLGVRTSATSVAEPPLFSGGSGSGKVDKRVH